MKFKSQQEEPNPEPEKQQMSNELYNGFIDLIQFEYNKLAIISSAKHYFWEQGLSDYKKFFKRLYESCEKTKYCLINQLQKQMLSVPEFRIPALVDDFDNPISPFEKMSELEDEFTIKLQHLITIAFEDKDWTNFHYLLNKIDTIDHLCCRALAAVKNKANVSALCE
mgnify:CR=1 FL=1